MKKVILTICLGYCLLNGATLNSNENVNYTPADKSIDYEKTSKLLQSQNAINAEQQLDYATKRYNFTKNKLDDNPDNIDYQQQNNTAKINLGIAQDNYDNVTLNTRESIKHMRSNGMSWDDITKKLKVKESTINHNYIKRNEK